MAEKTNPGEKTTAKKRATPKQEMLATLADVQKEVQERREAELKPEQRIGEKAVRQAVATADELSLDSVVKSISDLKSTISRMLTQLGDKLEAEVNKYSDIRKAIEAKDKELAEIFEIQKSASTLAALIETQQRKRDEFETEIAQEKEDLQREIEQTREEWESEKKAKETEAKEREAGEAKRRQREQEEYRYSFTREQQLAKEQFADEKTRSEREMALRKQETERQLAEREQTLAAREAELNQLRQRAEAFPKEQEAAVARAVKDALARAQAEAAGREELITKEFAGERSVLNTRITSLEQALAEQTKQLGAMSQKLEKAYVQIQEIAVKAIEGSANAKTIANLQQLLSDQVRKGTAEK